MSAVLNLSNLIDLAVGSKNVSEVNFKVLQTTLQAIVQHLNIQDTKVEFRGSDSENIQQILKNVQDETLKEIPFNIIPLQEEKDTTTPTPVGEGGSITSSDTMTRKRKTDSTEDIVIVESGKVQEPTKKRVVTQAYLTRLEAKVKALQGQIETLGTQVLPSDDVLLQTTRSQQEAKPISDLWQSLNITKRMSGAEEGIDKLASLLETVAKEYADLKVVIDRLEDELGQDIVETMKQIKLAANYAKQIRPREEIYREQLQKISKAAAKRKEEAAAKGVTAEQMESLAKTLSVQISDGSYKGGKQKSKKKDDEFQESEGSELMDETTSKLSKAELSTPSMLDDSSTNLPKTPMTSPSGLSSEQIKSKKHMKHGSLDSQTLFEVIQPIAKGEPVDSAKINVLLAQHEYMRKNMEYLTAQVNALADFADRELPAIVHAFKKEKGQASASKDEKTGKTDDGLENKVSSLESRLAKHASKIKRQDVMLNEKTIDYDKKLTSISNTVSDMFDVINTTQSDNRQDSNIIEDLITKVQNIEDAVVEVGCNAQELQDDKEHKTNLLQKLTTELELVKTGKADRYEIEDIFAEKADCYAVLEKVSQDVFDLACNDLAKGIDEALNRVSAQESLLAATMLELQNAIENKFDRTDVAPMREEFMERIDSLNKKLDKLAAMKEGRLAAAAKKKFITDVNCISCDRNVSMKVDNDIPCIPALADLPAMQSIGPYVTYELDHLRRMKAKAPGPGSFIPFEELAKRYNIKNLESYENLVDVPHLQTRYCGGSHTKLGPQQRVTHIGHFNIVKNINANK